MSAGNGKTTAISAVTWKQSSGFTLSRRGLYLKEDFQKPHITFGLPEVGGEPANTQLLEGEFFYSSQDHVLKYQDDSALVQTIVPVLTSRLSANGSAITSTTGQAFSLQAVTLLGNVYEVEWNVALIFSITTATLVAKVFPSSGTVNGLWTIEGTNGAPDGAAVAKRASTNDLTVTIGATTAIGNPGSTTKPVLIRVRGVFEQTAGATENLTLFLGSSSGSITPQKYSTMKVIRIA